MTVKEVLEWLNGLRVNALTVNDQEGVPLANRCAEAMETVRFLLTELDRLRGDIADKRDAFRNPMGKGYAPDIYADDLQSILEGKYQRRERF